MSLLSFLHLTPKTSDAAVFTNTFTIREERQFPVAPAALFHSLTDSTEVALWMSCPLAEIGQALGEPVLIKFPTGEVLIGVVCAFSAEATNFAYTCNGSILHFEVTATPTGQANLVFTWTSVAPDLATGAAAGYHGYFDALFAHLTGTARTSLDADLRAHYEQIFAQHKISVAVS